jgi:hypothetical protein
MRSMTASAASGVWISSRLRSTTRSTRLPASVDAAGGFFPVMRGTVHRKK